MPGIHENSHTRIRWWAPLWQGLVMDPEGKHYRRMGQAVWLFLYFILNANRHTGILMRKTATIAVQTGFSPRTIRKWLRVLRQGGYIATRTTGRYLQIEICLWKSIERRQNSADQGGRIRPLRMARDGRAGNDREVWNVANPSAKFKNSCHSK
jgi:hypothetical protein